ncbi:MAG: hypothetical protein ABSH08_10575 [Tepidisphaeraceae bacterium]|jgi:hypothetical protein
MRLGIFWMAMLGAGLALGRCALAADNATAGANLLEQAQKTDVVLASVLGSPQDPFASQQATPQSEWGDQQVNSGGAHFSLDFAYANRYIYRGVDHDTVATHGSSLNLLFDAKLEFDLGQYPHPFVEVFTNIYDADPLSRFQEIRPSVGADWDVKPFDLELVDISYIYPERESFNLPELDVKITLDDNLLLDTDKPILSPYVLGAFTYAKNEGWYIETGMKHDFTFEDLGLVITPEANIAWITGLKQQFVFVNTATQHCTGWQHLEFGLTITYSLNVLLNVSKKFGEFDVKGYGFYDDRLSAQITSTNAFWGGIGLGFKY